MKKGAKCEVKGGTHSKNEPDVIPKPPAAHPPPHLPPPVVPPSHPLSSSNLADVSGAREDESQPNNRAAVLSVGSEVIWESV